MLSDYELFNRLCKKYRIIIVPDILEAIKRASCTGTLQLSCQSIIPPICDIIGRVLVSSSAIKSIDLSDCLLISKGLHKILDALCRGSSVISLNLKGNNISGSTVSQLGEIFQGNNTLKCLNIEWNCLGCDAVFFERFCEGLAINNSIEELDLRYNQISFHCAESLSKVIKRNKSIKILNLSRNNLGLQGGQKILDAMQENHSIIKLNLRGNSISDDIIILINNLTNRNKNSEIISLSNTSKSAFLNDNANEMNSSIRNKTNEKLTVTADEKFQRTNNNVEWAQEWRHGNNFDKYLEISHSKLDYSLLPVKNNVIAKNSMPLESENFHRANHHFSDEALDSKTFEDSYKITELNKVLQDRTLIINSLMKDNFSKEAEIEATKSLVAKLEIEMTKLKGDYERIITERSKEIEHIKGNHQIREENLKEIIKNLEINHKTFEIKNSEWEAKVQQYESDIHKKSVEITKLNEKLVNKSKACEDAIIKYKKESVELTREWKRRERNNKIALNVSNRILKETAQALENCQRQFEKNQNQLYVTIEAYSNAKKKLNEMENIKVKYLRLEETFRKVQEEKSLMEGNFSESQRKIASLKKQINSLETELVEPQRLYNLLKEELEQEKQKTAKLKEELCIERSRLKEQDFQIQKYCQQIDVLNVQIMDIRKSHLDDMKGKDREHKRLNEIVACKNQELSDLRANEAQRATQLYMAFTKYLGSISSNTQL